ncbi:DEAD/DEAH box helicase family protein [Neisseria leonii]|uniref:restriction endonuclease n=1 Tax=Neisseria leonii TaxID=2995413 RepID=UPI00237B7299|nr:DEAD/DEAH box helicase family protein [Neisseria sp. 3986]MDD9325556.1 DEAD/DEAH box helicase family protein [Neisseria sp. 3986]
MQLKFEMLAYQHDAVDAVVRLFEGEPNHGTVFELNAAGGGTVAANRLFLSHTDMARNLHAVQRDFRQPETELGEHGLNFSVEMETGTGKTYVYLRTIFELNLRYGWKKFVIVVPSVAIREGVVQSIRATQAHFGVEFHRPVYQARVYRSDRLNDLRSFATGSHIEILLMNIDAFKKDGNVINRINESGAAPIEWVSGTNPIVIIDEPQNMETALAHKAIETLNPLFVLRYSATHKHAYHKIYSLNPIEAYNQKLVKQIEVMPVLAKNDVNGAYAALKEFVPGKGRLKAKVEIHHQGKKETKKKTVTVQSGDDLFEKSGGNESYRHGFVINGLDAQNGEMVLSGGQIIGLDGNGDELRDEVMKKQIEETVKEHLKKERKLKPKDIKVLSLFFIDKVAHYRNGGKFARWFEEIYERETGESAAGVHDGYFSQDKDTKGNSKADEDTYDLIMRDKEKLLSFDSPLRFIFSHSALKEGWDNPNVFQICTLNETQSPIKKRQEIGRGLRLCVNQRGERVRDEGVNILTVIANESYESFAANLQQEYQDECGITFGNGGAKNAAKRKHQTYRKGFTLDPLFLEIWQKLQHNTRYQVNFERRKLIQTASQSLKNMPAVEKPQIIVKKAAIHQNRTDGIWGEEKSSRAVQADMAWEIPDVLHEIQKKTRLTRQTVFEILQQSGRIGEIGNNPQRFIDLAAEKIQTALHGLMIEGIEYFKRSEAENGYAQSLARWQELERNGTEFFLNEYTFAINQENGGKKAKTIFADYIALDSQTEKTFAAACESRDDVLLYFKLPSWFTIPTPIGNYNPDWALVLENREKVYFVAETKNTGKGIQDGVDLGKLRESEQQKIACAEKHFAVLDGIGYKVVGKLSEI